ncbi:Ig-like domain-containing protein [Colwellia sp. D2M02]|uniref:Ig-like domain-containing protein n=1 Tax=Colwellia sp. D2M02 TaxID=2841562 RepID=UPI001C09402B|nr:Ig-like domain-containing protein [Colwellia sp. D2M02]MBU2893128.1 Ig-like domain-containing protein [Colwellia sp. D2M02]
MQNIKNLTSVSYAYIGPLLICVTLLSGCGSDGDSENLAKAVKLEAQRQNGTIIEKFEVSGGQTRLTKGDTHQLTAMGTDSKGEIRDITTELIWSSGDESIATVNEKTGLVTAIKNTEENQGIVVITAKTINDIARDVSVSVSDEAPENIVLKQVSPEVGSINTCIDARITGDITYQDGYQSLNTTRGVSFSVDDNSTAIINDEGDIFTSAATTEDSIIRASMANNVTSTLVVTADPNNLSNISVVLDEEPIERITMNVGERLQVNAQATLLAEVSEDTFDIDNSVSWTITNNTRVGLTETGDNKGTLFALQPGVVQVQGSCGGKLGSATIEIKGEADIEGLQINEGEDELTVGLDDSITLTLSANYTSTPSTLNVTEFAQWLIDGGTENNLINVELVETGTDTANYKITANKNTTGTVVISAAYDNNEASVRINIEVAE